MTRILAGCEIGLVKLAEAAMATAIIAVSGARPISAIAESTIGDINTTSAAVGMIIVAMAVRMYRPMMTGQGPASPSNSMTWPAR